MRVAIIVAMMSACTLSADVARFDSRIASDSSQASGDGIIWRDAAGIELESKVCGDTAQRYGRIPVDLYDSAPPGVKAMSGHSTGHYFLLETDSARFGVRWRCAQTRQTDPFIPPQGMYGVDIYERQGTVWRFVKNGRLGPGEDGAWQETRVELNGSSPHVVLVYLPIRANVLDVQFGVQKGAILSSRGHDSGEKRKIVHYGTSIVHGGCVSRPGLVFTSIAARMLDVPYVNLGFSGSARMEPVMADVMARADALLFVVDPVWNSSEEIIRERTEPFVRRLHELRPGVPILLCEGAESREGRMKRNDVFRQEYERLVKDKSLAAKLHYLPSDGMLPRDGESTHDYCHPNDYGAIQMGRVYAQAIGRILASHSLGAGEESPVSEAAATSKVARIVRCAEWRPVEMGEYECTQGKSVRIRELEIVPGTALDLSAIVPRYDIGVNGRIVSDSQGQLVFQNEPERPLRLRGFNCTYGGKYDGFQNASKEELEELAEQFRLMGLNLVRLHFFDAKLVGLNGLKWLEYKDTFAEDAMPQTKEEIDAIVDRDFMDRFHWFIKCLRDRGVYIMFDVATSPNKIMARAKKSRVPTRIGLFLDERWRKLWKASFDFWTQTINPYTGTRFLDDPQVIGMTFCNEQDWIFFSDQELAMFTTDFRKEFGEDMPELSRRLLWEDGKASENARLFFRRRLKEMTDFYLGVVKASGFKGLTTQWDMLKTPLGAESHIGLSAVATHSYHAHPKFSVPLPDGIENERILEPWNKGKCTEVPFGSSLAENKRTYFANAALVRTLGKPFLVTEYSHIPANDCAQEAPVVQSAIAALQDWQALCPHSDLVQLWHYDPYPFFDESRNLMARVSSVATAFGWQRGDIKRAPHAVSLSMTENVLASPALSGSLETAYVNLAFMTRVGVDAENAHNPLAILDIVPMREADAGKEEPLANDIQTATQRKSHGTTNLLCETVVRRLREAGVMPSGNGTDPMRGIYESETGEIVTDLRSEIMTIDAPRFQAAALKPRQTVRLSQLAVESVSTPASIIAISLDGDRFVSRSSRVLLIVATRFMQEGAIVSEDGKKMLFIDNGPTYTQLMRTGQFRFSIDTEAKKVPEVYALRMNGTRSFKIPVAVKDGRLVFDLDTSKFEYATPFFEIVRKE